MAEIHTVLGGFLRMRVDRVALPADWAPAFALEYRPGLPVSRSHAERFPPSFAAELESAIRGLHARGVVHLDLRHRSNVLAGDDGRPVLIDFGSALHLRPGGWLGRWLLPALASFDRRALTKWRRRFESYARSAGSTASSAAGGGTSEGGRGASRPT